MFLTNFLLSDILQYILNSYTDHRKDVHTIQKFTYNFVFDLNLMLKHLLLMKNIVLIMVLHQK
jgi:hypothetical protein